MDADSTSVQFRVGSRVRLSGGYDVEPAWLGGAQARIGTVMKRIPGQNETPAWVIELDKPISLDEMVGVYVVLELRYRDANWAERSVVHIELCDFEHVAARWSDRKKGHWVESHATCELVNDGSAHMRNW